MDRDASRSTGTLVLLLSLLLHVLFLLFLFLFTDSMLDKQHAEHPPLTPDDEQEVIIDLLPQGVDPNNTHTDDPGELVEPEPEEENAQEQPPQEQAPIDEEVKSDFAKATTDREKIEENELLPHADPTPQKQEPQEKTREKQPPKKVIRKIVQRPPLPQQNAQALSKITQGFIKSMSAELGNDPSNDPKQLARQHYMTKLWNAFKIATNSEENMLALSDDINTRGVFVLTIDKQGKLINALLRHPRKTSDLIKMERMLIANAGRVGLFPPIPDSFKQHQITFAMPIHLRAQKGIHAGYRLQVEQ